jgi:hypothetical protein
VRRQAIAGHSGTPRSPLPENAYGRIAGKVPRYPRGATVRRMVSAPRLSSRLYIGHPYWENVGLNWAVPQESSVVGWRRCFPGAEVFSDGERSRVPAGLVRSPVGCLG